MTTTESKSKSRRKKTNEELHENVTTGNLLQRLRIENGLNVEEVAEKTKISLANIRAIEDNDYDLLPADTFVRGLINIYADLLQADGPSLAQQFLKERKNYRSSVKKVRAGKTGRILSPKRMAEPSHLSSATVASSILFLIIVLFVSFCFYTSWNPLGFLFNKNAGFQSVMKSILPGDLSTNPKVISSSKDTELFSTRVQPDTHQKYIHTLSVDFHRDTSINITVDQGKALTLHFIAGEKQVWQAKESIQIIFNHPDSASLRLNGSPLPFPQQKNDSLTLSIPPK